MLPVAVDLLDLSYHFLSQNENSKPNPETPGQRQKQTPTVVLSMTNVHTDYTSVCPSRPGQQVGRPILYGTHCKLVSAKISLRLTLSLTIHSTDSVLAVVAS